MSDHSRVLNDGFQYTNVPMYILGEQDLDTLKGILESVGPITFVRLLKRIGEANLVVCKKSLEEAGTERQRSDDAKLKEYTEMEEKVEDLQIKLDEIQNEHPDYMKATR